MSEPLTEKYRPQTLADIIGQEREVAILQKFVTEYKGGTSTMPNLMFAGPPGTGKTTAARALLQDLFGEGWRACSLLLDASSDRGIDVVRGRVKDFAKTSPGNEAFNVVFLDEVDNMTADAQAALRRTMEDYAGHCRFILACNYPNKVIQPVIDRCMVLRFKAIPEEAIEKRLAEIALKEGVDLDSNGTMDGAASFAKGSMRRALQYLTGPFVGKEELLEERIRECIVLVYQGKTKDAEAEMVKLLRDQPSSGEVFLGLFDAMVGMGRPDRELYILGEYEFRVLMGGNLELQARCLLRQLGYLASQVKK